MRSLVLIVTLALAYAFLRGWPEDWHPITRMLFAVTSLVGALGLWGRQARPSESLAAAARPARRPRLSDLLVVGIAISLVECFFLIFLTLAPPAGEELAYSLEDTLFGETETTLTAVPEERSENGPASRGTGGGLITSNWLFSGPGPRSLNKSREVKPSNRPEVYLFPATAQDARTLMGRDRFIRNFTLARYQDEKWFPLSSLPRTLRATGETITRPTPSPGPEITYEISHPVNRNGQTLAITVPHFTRMAQPSLREISPDTFRLPPPPDSRKDYRYKVTSVLTSFEYLTEVEPGETPAPEFLELPTNEELRTKLATLAARFGQANRKSLEELRRYLRENCEYSLKLKMDSDDEPVDSFLFKTKAGYCTHFATATVLLARAMGMPSRIAFGWSGGRYFEGSELFVFRAKEAHAWAEIFVKDHGWIIFETTPPSREEGASSTAEANEAPPYQNDDNKENLASDEERLNPLWRWAGGLGLLGLLSLLTTLVARKPAPTDPPPAVSLNLLPAPSHYLRAFQRACQVKGHPIPPGRTLRAHLLTLPRPAFAEELLTYHYAVQYGGQPRNRTTEKRLLHELLNWEKES